jgi:acetate kinase
MVLNNGSSSLKCQILDVSTEVVLLRAQVNRIGGSESSLTVVCDSGRSKISGTVTVTVPDHFVALAEVLPFLAPFAPEIRGIGHRIVHGGEDYSRPVLITDTVEEVNIIDSLTL